MNMFKRLRKALFFLMLFCSVTVLILRLKDEAVKREEEEISKRMEGLLEKVSLECEDVDDDEIKREVLSRDGEIGVVTIPKIDVKAPVIQGTSPEVLKYAVRTF